VIEVKSHDAGHERGPIPAAHRSQMQWQMYVMGVEEALYIREVMDEDGQGALEDPEAITVERDDDYIAWLVSRADAFLEWWDNDCPETDDLDEETANALSEWVQAKRDLEPVAKKEAAAKKRLTAVMKKRPYAKFGVQLQGMSGGALLTAASYKRVIDKSRLRDGQKVLLRELEIKANASADALATFEASLLAEHGYDVLGGSQSLRLVGGAR